MRIQSKLPAIISIIIVLYACQGTYTIPGYVPPPATLPSGNNSSGSLLLKTVMLHGADTNDVATYTYNSNNQLLTLYAVAYSPGQKQATSYVITRDAAGKITQYSKQTTVNGLASGAPVIHYIHYPSGSNNFDYAISSSVANGTVIKDSTIYTFVNDLVSKGVDYMSFGGAFAKTSTYEYSYDANGNNTQIKLTIEGNPQRVVNYMFTYDNNNASMKWNNDNVLLTGYGPAKNNYLTTSVGEANPTPSSFKLNATYSYTYAASGYPSKGTSTVITKNPDSTMNYSSYYFYK